MEELPEGEMRGYVVGGERVLLVKHRGCVYAYEDRCAHQGQPLSDGTIHAGVITCSAHFYQFDARTGVGVNAPSLCLRALPVVVEGGRIEVDLDPIRRPT